MPSRGSYHIANPELRKAAQRDQSYRNCIATLFVFFFLFMVILIVCLSWRFLSHNKEDDKYLLARDQGGEYSKLESFITKTTTTTTRSVYVFEENVDGFFERQKSSNTEKEPTETSTSSIGNSTDPQDQHNTNAVEVQTTTQSELDYEVTNATTFIEDHETTSNIADNVTDVAVNTTVEYISTTEATVTNTESSNGYTENETTLETTTESDNITSTIGNDVQNITAIEVQTTTQSELDYEVTNATTLIEDTETTSNIPDNVTDVAVNTTVEYISTTEATVTNTESSNRYTENETTLETTTEFDNITSTIGDDVQNITAIEVRTTTQSELDYKVTNATTLIEDTETTSNIPDNVTDVAVNTTLEDISTTEATVTNTRSSNGYTENETTLETTTESYDITSTTDDDKKTCNTGHCRQVAAKILSFMNHTADPCEDFYEYACGGMIADPQIIDLNLANKAYQKIEKQMRKNKDNASSLFATYYNSCVQYGKTEGIKESIATVNEAINKIGKFYINRTEVWNQDDFTVLYAKLLLNYSPLLFDVVPVLDKENPNSYSIRIGPISHKNLFDNNNINDDCHPNESVMQKPFVDLQNTYETYTNCKKNNTRFLNTVSEALRMLGIFNNSYSMDQNIKILTFNIDTVIVDGFFSKFPPETEIREAYTMEKYDTVSISELNKTTTFINWYHLMKLLLEDDVPDNKNIQVYFYEQIVNGLQYLEKYWKKSKNDFYNAILGLYAQKLYHDLIIPKYEDVRQHCLRVSTNLLRPEASYLYMSSLSNKDIAHMTSTVNEIFDELKTTLKKHIETTCPIDRKPNKLLTKIDDLGVSVPKMSYFQYERDNKLDLSDKYTHNSLILMKRYRSLLYNVTSLLMTSDMQKEIWTHYATPFQSKGVVVYDLDLVVIPFGAIDFDDMFIENYSRWATIGNLIAHQISHHFDANGIYYWNQTRHTDTSLLNVDFPETENVDHYIDCQIGAYENPMNMTLPATSQTISFKIPEHTLNERISEIMGLRLTHDTLERLKLFSKNPHLPWLELNSKQLFYLTYAQTYCTKSLLTTSYISLYENEELPSRIHVFVSASSDNLLGKSWNCPQGSHIVPSSTCNVLPFQTCKEIEINFE